jgi:hypothetical protein
MKKGLGGMAQITECLPSKHKVLSSNASTAKGYHFFLGSPPCYQKPSSPLPWLKAGSQILSQDFTGGAPVR